MTDKNILIDAIKELNFARPLSRAEGFYRLAERKETGSCTSYRSPSTVVLDHSTEAVAFLLIVLATNRCNIQNVTTPNRKTPLVKRSAIYMTA
eukprot:CCRYP_018600-RA/>CCRYP_018600-RA protein AED:0.07 eAED:0.07 QI:1178/1/1/1/0/0/2/204/92